MSGLIGARGQTTAPKIGGLRLQTSLYSIPIPIVYGRARLTGNLIHFPQPPSIQNGDKIARRAKGTASTARYFAPVIIALCEGQIAGVAQVWSDKNAAEDFQSIFVAKNGWEYRWGAPGQSAIDFLLAKQAVTYPKLAYVAHPNLELPNGSLQNYSWEVNGLLQVSADIVDANASAVLLDYLTNADHGLLWPSSKIGDLTQWNTYITAMGLFLSPVFDTQGQARSQLQELFDATNTAPYWSDGKLKAVPYGDQPVTGNGVTFTPNSTPLYDFTDDHFLEPPGTDPVRCVRKRPSQCYNQLVVEFEDRGQQYSPNVVEVKIEADLNAFGPRPAPKVQLRSIKTAPTARLIAQLMLQRMNAIRNTYQFEVGWQFSAVEPMDLATLTDSGLGLSKTPVRIIEVTELADEAGLQITAEEWPFGHATATAYNAAGAAGYTSSQDVDPGSTSTPAIFEGPFPQVDSELELWIAASGGSTWGGCEVWISTDNQNFYYVDRIIGKASYGVLSAMLAGGAPLPAIDTANTLAVDLTSSGGTLVTGSASDVPALLTLCYVDGEYVAFQTATLVAASKYNLTTLGRGAYSSPVPLFHRAGSTFVRCDDSVFHYPFPQGVNGQTVYFKFPAFNLYGKALQDIATVPSVAHTIAGIPDESSRSLNGLSYTDSPDNTERTFTWTPGSLVVAVYVYIRTLTAPITSDPFNFTGAPPTEILRVGINSLTVQKPPAHQQTFVQLEPRLAGGVLLDGTLAVREIVDPMPTALAVSLKRTVTDATCDLAPTVTGNTSDWPIRLRVYEDDPTSTPIVDTMVSQPADGNSVTFTKADFAALGGRALPQRELRHWWALATNIAGADVWDTTAADRDALPVGAVTPLDYRSAPQLVVVIDNDTDAVKITVGNGKTKTVTTPAGTNLVTYSVGDTLDDGSHESLLNVDEKRVGYSVALEGGGSWLPIWNGSLHGTPSNPPTVKPRVVPNATASTEDVYITVESPVNEPVRLYFRDTEDSAAPIYGLVDGGGNPLYEPPGTEIGPASNFKNTDGTGGLLLALAAIALTRDQVKRIYVQAEGQQSLVRSAWIPVVLSLLAQPYLESFSLTWDDSSGKLRARLKGGAFCASAEVDFSDVQDFSTIASTSTVALAPGGEQIVLLGLSGAERGITWYARGTPNNEALLAGLPGVAMTDETPVPALAILNVRVVDNKTLAVDVTDPGSIIDGTNRIKFYVTPPGGARTLTAPTSAPSSGTTGTYEIVITLDELHNTIVEPIAYYADSSAKLLGPFTFDADTTANVENLTVAYNGQTATVTAVFDSDTAVGAATARYRINGGSWTTIAVSSALQAQFNVTASTSSIQTVDVEGQNAAGEWGPLVSTQIDVYVNPVGPTLVVTPTPGSSSYSIAWSGTGTITVSIDGGSYTTPNPSPIPVIRDGSDHTYAFKAIGANGQTITASVTVPALGSSGGVNGSFSGLSNTINTYGNPGKVNFAWSWTGSSCAFEVWVRDPGTYSDQSYHYCATTAVGATSYVYTAGESLSTAITPSVTIGFQLKAVSGDTYGPTSTVSEANYGSP